MQIRCLFISKACLPQGDFRIRSDFGLWRKTSLTIAETKTACQPIFQTLPRVCATSSRPRNTRSVIQNSTRLRLNCLPCNSRRTRCIEESARPGELFRVRLVIGRKFPVCRPRRSRNWNCRACNLPNAGVSFIPAARPSNGPAGIFTALNRCGFMKHHCGHGSRGI